MALVVDGVGHHSVWSDPGAHGGIRLLQLLDVLKDGLGKNHVHGSYGHPVMIRPRRSIGDEGVIFVIAGEGGAYTRSSTRLERCLQTHLGEDVTRKLVGIQPGHDERKLCLVRYDCTLTKEFD